MKTIKNYYYIFPSILIVVFPILSFYVNNIGELTINFLDKPLFYSVLASILMFFLLLKIIKNKEKASLVTTLLLFIFFSYGHLSNFLNDKLFIELPRGIVLGPDKILLPIVFATAVYIIVKIIKSHKGFTKLLNFLNFILVILVSTLIIQIVSNQNNRIEDKLNDTKYSSLETNTITPDIYHIILDGYAREDVLQDIYDYDNSEFTKSLEDMGFFVADKARTNYIHTYISLPSTFNMTYLDDLTSDFGENPASGRAARDMMIENKVTKILKNHKYTTINFATWWDGTADNYPADITYNKDTSNSIAGLNIAVSQSNVIFLQTTLLSPLIKEVWGDALRGKILYTLQNLPDVPYIEGKKYTIAHIITPHPPYIFSEDGGIVEGSEFETADEGVEKRPKYMAQLKFISNQIIPVLKSIIDNSDEPPIIILQSDHGPASIFGKREEWQFNYSNEALKERSGILYAVYLPDKDYSDFYDEITPVNTYRIILNKYFGSDYDLLPDNTYYTDYDAIYKFKDVTNEVK